MAVVVNLDAIERTLEAESGGDSVKQGGVVIQIKDPSGKDVDVASEYDGLVVARLRALDDA